MDEYVVLAGENVLCYHGPLLYAAKCNKIQNDEDDGGRPVVKYRIHYLGWRARYDEWVTADRLVRANEEGLALQQELIDRAKKKKEDALRQQKEEKEAEVAARKKEKAEAAALRKQERAAKKRAASEAASEEAGVIVVEGDNDSSSASGARARKRARKSEDDGGSSGSNADSDESGAGEATADGEAAGNVDDDDVDDGVWAGAQAVSPHDDSMALPPVLRKQLVDDWNYVSQERRLVPLPAKRHLAVSAMLKAFVAHASKSKPRDATAAREVAVGAETAFNAAVGSVLLYPFERLQYAELTWEHPDVPYSSLFGVEHFVRLLVVLPEQLALEKVPSGGRLARGVALLTEFIADRASMYLADEYEMAPPQYIRANNQLGHGKAEA